MSDLLVKGVGLLAGIGYVGLVAMMLWAMFSRSRKT